jgi:hypothetical protein
MTLGAFRGRLARRMLSIPLVSIVGGACYTIYLFHFQLVSMFGRFLAPHTTASFERNIVLIAVPFSCAVILACLCLFPFVERPFMHGRWPQLVWQALRSRDWRALAPLFARGLFLVGLDVIGDCLTEVNVTSPTCFREIAEQTGFDVAALYVECLEREVARPR